MRIFFQKVFLDILHARTRFAVIFFGLLLSSVTVVSLASLSSSLNYTTVIQNEDLKLADISFLVSDRNNSELGISPSIVNSLTEVDIVESVSVIYKSSVSLEGTENGDSWTRNCYLQNLWENDTIDNLPEVDRVRIVEGRFFNRTDEQGIIISEYLWDAIREDHPGSIEINKNISIILLGKEITVPIIGVAYNPRLWQNCFIPTGFMHDLDNNTELINSINIRLSSILEEDDIAQKIELLSTIVESEAQILAFRIQPRNESLTPQVTRGVEKLAGIIGVGTLIIGLILTYYIMITNINDQKKEIAIMRSAGATRKHIMLFYSLQAAIIGFTAWIIGIIIGIPISIVGLDLLSEAERLSGNALLYIDFIQLAILTIICLILTVAATLYPAFKASSFPIVEVLRGSNSDDGDSKVPTFVFSPKISPSIRYSLVNIFSNLQSVIMRVFTVLIIIALALAMVSLSTNFRDTLDFATDEEFTFDLAVQFSPYAPEVIEILENNYTLDEILKHDFEEINDIENVYGEIGRFNISGHMSNYWIFGIGNKSDFLRPKLLSGRWINGSNEMMISEKVANDLDLDINDNLSIQIPGKEPQENDQFKIVGIVFTLWQFGNTIYCERISLQKAFSVEDRISVMFIKLNDGIEVEDFKLDLIKELEFQLEISGGTILSKNEIQDMLRDIRDSVSLLLILIIAILVSSILLLLIIMTNLDLTRRIREIATMKSVGMTTFQSFKVISCENLLLNTTCAIIGTIVALPIFNFLYDQINSNVVPLLYEFDLSMMIGINIIIVVFLTIPVVLIFTVKIGRTPVASLLSGDIRV